MHFSPPEAKAIQRERDAGYANYRTTGSADSLAKIGELSSSITDAVNESKKKKRKEFCQNTDYHSDPKGDMDIIKSLSGIQRQAHSYEGLSGPSVPNRFLLTDPLKEQAFCAHFSKAPFGITKEEKKILLGEKKVALGVIKTRGPYNEVSDITRGEIESSIKRCKNGRTPGVDSVNNELLKELPGEALLIIGDLFNSILKNGILPQLWKRIILVPIPKRGKDSKPPSDSRPVDLSCSLVKISERMILDRTIHGLSETDVMSNAQHGFRSHKSAHTSIICIMQQIMGGFNQIDTLSKGKTKLKSGLFCLDLKGAFDSIRMEVVLENLNRLGVQSTYVGIIRQCLARREVVVRFRHTQSSVAQNRVGLPQGSVFSPFLFACVLDSMIAGFKDFTIRSIRPTDFLAIHLSAFDDDMALAITDVSFKDIMTISHQCVGEIERWAITNFQRLSPGKCEGILFACSSKGLKYIENPTEEILCCVVDLPMKSRLQLLGFSLGPL